MRTATRIVLLMHPKEDRREKCATGRLTHLNLHNSQIITGVAFDANPELRKLVDDPDNYPMLLYPGPDAYNLSAGGFPPEALQGRRLVVFLVDATWSCARSILRASPGLLGLPQLRFDPTVPSRYIIKRQPRPDYLSTIEATHELLLALDRAGLDSYQDKDRLLTTFFAMRDYQIEQRQARRQPRFVPDHGGTT